MLFIRIFAGLLFLFTNVMILDIRGTSCFAPDLQVKKFIILTGSIVSSSF